MRNHRMLKGHNLITGLHEGWSWFLPFACVISLSRCFISFVFHLLCENVWNRATTEFTVNVKVYNI